MLDSIGYLAVVVGRSSIWALLLMAGPIALLTVTTRVLDRAQSDRTPVSPRPSWPQTSPMLPTTSTTWSTCSCGRRARCCAGRPWCCGTGEPSPGEFGAALTIAGAEKWLVATPRELSKTRPEDSQALHALVGMVQSVVANRALARSGQP